MTSADAATPARGRLRRLARAVACGLVVALVVLALALLVRTQFGPLMDADRTATRSATDVRREHPGLLHLLLSWQRLSSARYLYVVATLACLWVWRRHHLTTRALWAFVTMMVGWNLAHGVKDLVQRARPVVSDPVSHAQGSSSASTSPPTSRPASCSAWDSWARPTWATSAGGRRSAPPEARLSLRGPSSAGSPRGPRRRTPRRAQR